MFVLDAVLSSRQRVEVSAQARAVLGAEPPDVDPTEPSPRVRFAVWCRDRGRCVGATTDDVGWAEILPPEDGRSKSAANV